MRLFPIYIVFGILLLGACKKDAYEIYIRNTDEAYYNDSVGSLSVFDVNEVVFDDFSNSSDTFNYQIMEVNESEFKDNMGRVALKIDRYKRSSDTSLWKYQYSCYTVSDKNMVERVEDNKRFIKLSFPVTADAVWNSNAYNLDNAINVFYGAIDKPYNQDTFKFKKTISVESTIINNNFRERSFKEIYALGIGLVYKNQVAIERNGSQWRGYKIRYKLIKHAL